MGAPLLLDTAAVKVGERNAVGRRMVKRTQTVLNFGGPNGGASGGATRPAAQGSIVEIDVAAGRISWREILNWQELRDAAKNR
jgi:type IV pilus assembly protein PilY1